MAGPYEDAAARPLDLKLYYVLPHYHALGDYFRLEIMGGPRDGEVLLQMEGFNAEANGKTFDPPVDLTGATGLRMTCGYNNPTGEEVNWGIGDQEMCEFLGLADTAVMMDGWVREHNPDGTMVDGVVDFVSPCTVQAVPKNEKQTMPTQDEINAPLYRPGTNEVDANTTPVEVCQDTPEDAVAEPPLTLASVNETIFVASCNYSACHGGATAAGGLDLAQDNLLAALAGVDSAGRPGMPLVDPGYPDNSYLYHLLSTCTPRGAGDVEVSHMPLNSPTLMDPGLVAKVREWIRNGAMD